MSSNSPVKDKYDCEITPEVILESFRDPTCDCADIFCRYWVQQGYDNWCQVSEDARILWNEIFDDGTDPIENESPMSDFLMYVAIAGFDSAIKAVGILQKIDAEELKRTGIKGCRALNSV